MSALVALPSRSSSDITLPVPRLLLMPHTEWPAATKRPTSGFPPRIGAAVRGERGK